PPQAEPSGVMEQLVLGLWALLVSVEFCGGATEPVSSQALCKPAACYSTDPVCVSNVAIVTISESLGAGERAGAPASLALGLDP
ncbi:hypothetical protein HPG69_008031, partial [Diceros bicornis minor]